MANEMRGYPDHGWRADEYTLIRGDLHAAVSRSWCADTECSTGWRWSLYRILDPLEQIDPPVDVKRYGFRSKGDAMIAVERFMASIDDAERYRRAASFEGVPVPGDAEAF